MSFRGFQDYQTVTFSLEWRVLHQAVHLPFGLGVVVSSTEELKGIVLSIPWGGDRTLPQVCSLISWWSPDDFLSLHSLPSLLSNCLNLPFGTQGRSWRLEPMPYKQETRDTERLPCPGAPHRGLSVSMDCGRGPRWRRRGSLEGFEAYSGGIPTWRGDWFDKGVRERVEVGQLAGFQPWDTLPDLPWALEGKTQGER